MFGGSGDDQIFGIAVAQYKTVYIAGRTSSGNLPQLASFGAPDSNTLQGFVASIVPSGPQGKSIHYYSTTLAGPFSPGQASLVEIRAIALDPALNAYVAGYSGYPGFPVTPGAFQPHFAGGLDAFISKLAIEADLALAISSSPSTALRGGELTYTLITQNDGPDWAQYLKLDDAVPAGTTFVSYNAGGRSCTAPAVGGTGNAHCTLPRLDKGGAWRVQIVVRVDIGAGASIANTGHERSNMQEESGGRASGQPRSALAGCSPRASYATRAAPVPSPCKPSEGPSSAPAPGARVKSP